MGSAYSAAEIKRTHDSDVSTLHEFIDQITKDQDITKEFKSYIEAQDEIITAGIYGPWYYVGFFASDWVRYRNYLDKMSTLLDDKWSSILLKECEDRQDAVKKNEKIRECMSFIDEVKRKTCKKIRKWERAEMDDSGSYWP